MRMRFEICHENGKIPVELYCEQPRIQNVKNMTFIEDRGIISMEASHFAEKKKLRQELLKYFYIRKDKRRHKSISVQPLV